MTLRQYLSIPFVLSVQSVTASNGSWERRAFFPEMEGSEAQGLEAVDVVQAAECQLVRCLVRRLERGEPVPVPRRPLQNVPVEELLAVAGLERWTARLDEPVAGRLQ